MNTAIACPSSSIVVTLQAACHAGGRALESRRSNSKNTANGHTREGDGNHAKEPELKPATSTTVDRSVPFSLEGVLPALAGRRRRRPS
jgi:hypothetical protein